MLSATLLVVTVFLACNQAAKDPFTLTGEIEGIKDGKIEFYYYVVADGKLDFVRDTVDIKDGKFSFSGNFEIPQNYSASIIGNPNARFGFYAENTHMKITANIKDLNDYKIEGSQLNIDAINHRKASAEIRENNGYNKLMDEFMIYLQDEEKKNDPRRFEIEKEMDAISDKVAALTPKFIKENPGSYYSVILTEGLCRGKAPAEIEALVKALSPEMQQTKAMQNMLAKASELKATEIGLDKIIQASNVSYKIDKTFKGKDKKDVVYLGMASNDKVCALKEDGTVLLMNSNGKSMKSFKAELKGKASCIAVDLLDNMYVFSAYGETETQKIRGKVYERFIPKGISCAVYNTKGKKVNAFDLEGAKTATGARIADGKLIVANYGDRQIGIYDKENGKLTSKIEGMRPCCGILDFSVNEKNEVLVANLGAFRVESYDFTGKKIVAFGSRGRNISEFHGCCNPVSVAYLSNGAIVTVEKDPTQVKVFSKEGAKMIQGVEELVKGCSYIPMIVDSKNNLYLASPEKGMIKCVSL